MSLNLQNFDIHPGVSITYLSRRSQAKINQNITLFFQYSGKYLFLLYKENIREILTDFVDINKVQNIKIISSISEIAEILPLEFL